MSFGQKIKRSFWNLIYPIFPYIEHLFVFAHQRKRQRFHIGWISPGKTLADMKAHLSHKYQFGNHFVAWEDSDQVLSWRKLDGFEYQYHLRVYKDGELRGHYEKTPEAAPIAHFFEQEEEPRTEDFLMFLGPFVSKYRFLQDPPLHPQHNTHTEITFVPTKGK